MRRWLLGISVGLVVFLFSARFNLRALEPPAEKAVSPLTVSQVVSRMVEMNKRRSEALRSYTSIRSYHIDLRGLIHIHAKMEVKMTYQWPGKKHFTILSQSGSAFMRNHVLKRLVEAEHRASKQGEHRKVSITPRNYNFQLAGYEHNADGNIYILDVIPKTRREFLFKGRVWVSGRNYSIVRIEGKPAKTLSWWTPKVNFVYQYKKVGDFWFPALNKTVTQVRIFGRSLLTIQYKEYDLTDVRNFTPFGPVKPLLSDRMRDATLIPPSHSQN